MNISGIGGAGASQNTAGMTAGKSGQMDPESKNLQQQIEKLQNELKEVSANQDIPADTKMKKRQEIQKQISDLQIQLRQHQIDARKAEREKKKEESSFDDLLGTKPQQKQENGSSMGMSAESMTAMVAADVSVKQANVYGSTAQKMEGRANVLEVEMQLDGGRGGSSNVDLKESELADAKEAAQKATASQLDSLAQAGETLQNAAKNDQADNRTEDKEKDEGKDSGDAENSEEKQMDGTAETVAGESSAEQNGYGYHPVDVRL